MSFWVEESLALKGSYTEEEEQGCTRRAALSGEWQTPEIQGNALEKSRKPGHAVAGSPKFCTSVGHS